MPLQSGTSKKVLAENIAELHHANASKAPDKKRPNKQIIAIAFAKMRESKKDK